jgi:phosphatidylserine/phosphatidylglycerophosphate/cardiolipin synthase-like enzyme
MRIARLLARSALAVLLLSAAGTALVAGPQAEAMSTFEPIRAVFNNPNGSISERYRIVNYVNRAIDAAPTGSVIRIAMYSMYVQSTTDKLIAARKRGVTVQMVTDDHYTSPQLSQLVKTFGTRVAAGGSTSFVKICHRSCSSDLLHSYMHAKFFTFSQAGSHHRLVMVTSSNFSDAQINLGWNNMYTLVDSPKIYSTLNTYFTQLTRDANNKATAYQETVDGNAKVYAFPRWEGKVIDANSDTYYGILGHITCSGTASGYGKNGKTAIHVASYQWTKYRLYLAQKLWNLDNAGCDVSMVYSARNTDALVTAALKKAGGKHGGIRLHNADQNGPGDDDKYSHNKYVLVNGVYDGDTSSRIVFTGSANFNKVGLRYNNEVVLKLRSSTAYGAYYRNFQTIYAYPTKQTNITPPRTVEGRPED